MITRKDLVESDVTFIRDTREQDPIDFGPYRYVVKGLKTGDYSILGYEDRVSIERKSLDDLVACVTRERERFRRELERLKSFEHKAIVGDFNYANVIMKQYRSMASPNAVRSSIASFAMSANCAFLPADTHIGSGEMIQFCLWTAARKIFHSDGVFRCGDVEVVKPCENIAAG